MISKAAIFLSSDPNCSNPRLLKTDITVVRIADETERDATCIANILIILIIFIITIITKVITWNRALVRREVKNSR